jgi:CHAT domain/Tetratricopeptide repeat
MADIPLWISFAREYLAQGRTEARDKAAQACADADVKQTLLDPQGWKGVNQRLVSEGRSLEAGTVELLGLRPLASTLDSVERLNQQQRNDGLSACNRAATVSNALQFGECEAYFLAMLGACASKLRDFTQAASLLTRSLELRRAAAKVSPVYDFYIAATLSNLAIVFSERKLFLDAGNYLDESLAIYRRLAGKHPDYYRPWMAITLTNLGVVRRNARDLNASLAALLEAVALYRGLPQSDLATRKGDFATALAALSSTERSLRDLPAARHSVEAALDIYRELAKNDPRPWLPNVALCSHNLGNILSDQDDPARAETAYLEALKIYQPLAAAEPARYNGQLASTLNKLGSLWIESERAPDAAQAFARALSINRQLALAQPEVYRSEVVTTLDLLANAQEKLKDMPGALQSRKEAIEIGRQLAALPERAYKPELARLLNNFASQLREQGDEAGCDAASREAVELVESDSNVRSLWLAKAKAAGAYKHLLEVAARSNQPDAVFRALAALREGPVLALGQSSDESLKSACSAMAEISKRVGRPVCVLAAQSMHRSGPGRQADLMLAMLSESTLQYQTVYPFAEAAYELFTDLQGVFNEVKPGGAAYWKQRMLQLGSAAWKALPQSFRDVLHPNSNVEVLISGDSYWAAFPWEALRFGDGEQDYLGWWRALARWSPLTARTLSTLGVVSSAGQQRTAAVLCPWDLISNRPLPGARAEAAALGRDMPQLGFTLAPGSPAMGPDATVQSLAASLRGGVSVFHYTGHGGIIGNEEAMLLHGGAIGSAEVRDLSRSSTIFAEGALVVLNSCLTGRVRDYGGRREDLAGTFLEEGARGVVASALPVADPIGQILGTAIYPCAAGRSMGKALAGMRKIVAWLAADVNSNSYPTWTMLQYHGDPWLVLTADLHGPVPGLVEAVASFLQTTPGKAADVVAEYTTQAFLSLT